MIRQVKQVSLLPDFMKSVCIAIPLLQPSLVAQGLGRFLGKEWEVGM
jgi:hypothetical protein